MTPGLQGQELGNPSAPRAHCLGQPFNPYKLFPGILIPEPVCKYKGLSPGAKMVYVAYAATPARAAPPTPPFRPSALRSALAKPKPAAISRNWNREGRFLAVDRQNRHFRKDGSGGSNSYVFLWHPAFIGDSRRIAKGTPTPAENRRGTPSANRTPDPCGKPNPKRVSCFKRVR